MDSTPIDEATSVVEVRLGARERQRLEKRAARRGLTLAEYIRKLSLASMRRTEKSSLERLRPDPARLIQLSAAGQLALWEALKNPPPPPPGRDRLGRLMRGEE